VDELLGVVPNLGDNRSNREAAADLSATDGAGPCAGGLCGAGRGVTVLTGSGVLLDWIEGRAGVEGVSRRWVAMRSSSELRERLLRSETLGDDVGAVRSITLSEPTGPPILLVPPKPGESLCRGTDNVLDDSDLCEPIGAAIRLESGTVGLAGGAKRGTGVLMDGRDGLTVIDLPGLADGLEDIVGVGLLGLIDGLGVDDRCLNA